MSLPIQFHSIYQQRVWGGRKLETVYGRILPDAKAPFGESWEITDREDAQSIVASGEFEGMTLHQLWTERRSELFGDNLKSERFPLLLKILDSHVDLSIQVHPPENVATQLGTDSKTEMWYIADAEPESKIYVGLKRGVTRDRFESSLTHGNVAQQVHTIEPGEGESIFIPSGRVHALGAGFLIYEIQQNSDTTYRVFDWNRVGLDGKPRDLHLKESMQCIDFDDIEPKMMSPSEEQRACISQCSYFHVDQLQLSPDETIRNPQDKRFSILIIVSGMVEDVAGNKYQKGDFLIMPRESKPLSVLAKAVVLQTTIPEAAI